MKRPRRLNDLSRGVETQRRRCAGRRSIASRPPPGGEQSATRTERTARLTKGDTGHAAPTALGMVAATRDAERRTATPARPRHRHLPQYTTSVRGASAHGDDATAVTSRRCHTEARRISATAPSWLTCTVVYTAGRARSKAPSRPSQLVSIRVEHIASESILYA